MSAARFAGSRERIRSRRPGLTVQRKAAKTQLTADDWVNAAINVMVASGVADVKVERLASVLGVSKGSFYWHFKTREELLSAVLTAWTQMATFNVQARLEREEPDPARKLLRFMQLPLRSERALRMADLELAIMGWARRASSAREALELVDRSRTNNIASMLHDLGAGEAKALDLAHQIYAMIRYVSLRRDLGAEARRALIEDLHHRVVESARTPG